MSEPATVDLQAELDALRAENAALRQTAPIPPLTEPVAPRRHNWWRGLIAAVCIVLAGILVPISIVGAWAKVQLVNEDAFVATFAPLADDPGVQQLVIDQSTAAIENSLDVSKYTNDLFDGLSQLNLPRPALSALELLRQPAADAVSSLIDTTVTKVVQSDAFSAVWQRALIASHRALVAAATNTQSDVVSVSDTGALGIQLGPIIDELKQRLIDRGIGFASAIPTVDKTIVIVQSDALLLVGTVYSIAVAAGSWLPFLTLALFAIGIAVARRRSAAVLGTGIAIALGAAALAIALATTGTILGLRAGQLGISGTTINTIFYTVVGAMQDTAIVFIFLGVIVAISAWFSGRSRQAQRARALTASLTGGARDSLQRRGMNTGGFGAWLYRQRVLVRLIILALAIVLLFALRPLSIGDIVLTLVLGLLVWLIVTLLARDPLSAVTAADADALPEPVLSMESAGAAEPTDDDLVTAAVMATPTATTRDAATEPAAASEAPKGVPPTP